MFKTLELPGGFVPLAPLPGLCPGPTGGLKRSPDPSPNNFAPPISNSGYGPADTLDCITFAYNYNINCIRWNIAEMYLILNELSIFDAIIF